MRLCVKKQQKKESEILFFKILLLVIYIMAVSGVHFGVEGSSVRFLGLL